MTVLDTISRATRKIGTPLVYMASPYNHDDPAIMEQRFKEACRAAAWLMQHGVAVFAPIVHGHPLRRDYGLPQTHEFWLAVDFVFLRRCQCLIVLRLEGWRESIGVSNEIKVAQGIAMPILYLAPNGDSYDLQHWSLISAV